MRRRSFIAGSIATASGVFFRSGAAMSRTILSGHTYFYVNPSGSDSNDGLTPSTPWQTVQFGCHVMRDKIDFNGNIGILKLADGIYTDPIDATGPVIGAVQFFIEGNTTAPSNVVLLGQSSAPNLAVQDKATVTISGVKFLRYWNGDAVMARQFAIVDLFNVEFGNVGSGRHIFASEGARVNILGPYTITGDASVHLCASGTGSNISLGGIAVDIPSSRTFSSAFAMVSLSGNIVANGAEIYTGAGAATGSNGHTTAADSNGVIHQGSVTFPGNLGPITPIRGGMVF